MLKDQVAVITGAGRGIGREIALTFARSEATLVLVSRTGAQLDEVAGIIRSAGGTALTCCADVTNADCVRQVVAEATARFGRIDILVNNAAANYVSNLLLSDDQKWRDIFEVNVFGVYLCTKAVLPHMIRARSGRIINIASVAGQVGVAYNSAYSASKAAVIGFTKAVALEVAKLGITVNAICPWHVDTELVREAMAARGAMFNKSGEDYMAGIVARSPQQRLITTEEVAALALFLSQREATGMTGQALNVSGGAVMT